MSKSPPGDLVEVSDGEAKNGWTAETLTAYLAERQGQKMAYASHMAGAGRPSGKPLVPEPMIRPGVINTSTFSPHRW